MFDIELAIEQWKQSFDSIDTVRPDDVLELESHLRELVSELRKRELSDREAFMVATQRLGNAAELNGEFAKVNGATVWHKRVLWMLCGYVVYSVGSALIQTAATLASTSVAIAGVGATATGATATMVLAIGWAILLAIAYRQSKRPVAGPDRMPIVWGLIAGLAMIVGYGLCQGGVIIQARYVELAEFGESQIWREIGGLAVHLCVFAASVVLMWTLSEPRDDTFDTVR